MRQNVSTLASIMVCLPLLAAPSSCKRDEPAKGQESEGEVVKPTKAPKPALFAAVEDHPDLGVMNDESKEDLTRLADEVERALGGLEIDGWLGEIGRIDTMGDALDPTGYLVTVEVVLPKPSSNMDEHLYFSGCAGHTERADLPHAPSRTGLSDEGRSELCQVRAVQWRVCPSRKRRGRAGLLQHEDPLLLVSIHEAGGGRLRRREARDRGGASGVRTRSSLLGDQVAPS